MKIINGKKFYKRDMDAAVRVDGNGWDHNNGRNVQWYELLWDQGSGYVCLDADNSGDCYGDYSTREFDSPEAFFEWASASGRDVERLLGDINEDDSVEMDFADRYIRWLDRKKQMGG